MLGLLVANVVNLFISVEDLSTHCLKVLGRKFIQMVRGLCSILYARSSVINFHVVVSSWNSKCSHVGYLLSVGIVYRSLLVVLFCMCN